MTTKIEKRIYFFGNGQADGNGSKGMKELLGNKGAQLHEMTKMGLPVPPGFTLTTEVGRHYFESGGQLPDGLMESVKRSIKELEKIVSLKFGDVENDPLLVSARSGAAISMPGMMETVLNIGLTDDNVNAYRERHSSEQASKFILDSYRRLLEMFGENVHGLEKEAFRNILDDIKAEVGVNEDTKLISKHMETIVSRYKGLYSQRGKLLPQDPIQQLKEAIIAVEESSMGEKALNYRKAEGLPDKVFTGVNIQSMVYGNENTINCGTGVGFTRNPETGAKEEYGEFLLGGQGEDVVGGRRNVHPLSAMKDLLPEAYNQLMDMFNKLEKNKKEPQDIEFTVWNGKLYSLQTRDAKMTGRARVKTSYDMFQEGLISERDAIERVSSEDIEQLLHPMIDYNIIKKAGIDLQEFLMGKGVPASPGGGVGQVVFDIPKALEFKERGIYYILCRIETDPADYAGMVSSQAMVTARGGKTSHAAVVARNKGIPAAVGTGINIDEVNKTMTYMAKGNVVTVKEGDYISVDGSAGEVFNYKAELTKPNPNDADLQNFLELLKPIAKMRVYANANDATEAKIALQFGAEGIGLARTEYMFLEDKAEGENRALTIQSWVLAKDNPLTKSAASAALDKLERMQQKDFLEMYNVMKDKPIIIRLLDYPMHELLSKSDESLVELSGLTRMDGDELMQKINGYREKNPMLGHRSVRLGITDPEVYRMQVKAILSAGKEYNNNADSNYVTPHIEIPLVSMQSEILDIVKIVEEEANVLDYVRGGSSSKGNNRYRLGIMYETPGSVSMASELAEITDFGSFGTNDLTQTVLGWSREDGDTTFMPSYIAKRIVEENPFIRIDENGPVAKQVLHAVLMARSINPDYDFGVCGEHAANPKSLEVFYRARLTNVSPGPNQVPIAWLKSAQLSLTEEPGSMLKKYASDTMSSFQKVIDVKMDK